MWLSIIVWFQSEENIFLGVMYFTNVEHYTNDNGRSKASDNAQQLALFVKILVHTFSYQCAH